MRSQLSGVLKTLRSPSNGVKSADSGLGFESRKRKGGTSKCLDLDSFVDSAAETPAQVPPSPSIEPPSPGRKLLLHVESLSGVSWEPRRSTAERAVRSEKPDCGFYLAYRLHRGF